MNLNFPLILVLATGFFGAVWLIDAVFFAPRRRRRLADAAELVGEDLVAAEQNPPLLVDYARSFFPVLLIVLVLRSFLFEPFKIPSGSMIPTLLIGDFILVNKFAYGVRLPVIHTKILDTGSPKRGDVAVFRYPNDPRQDYIKRVVGVPGDVVEYRNKTFTINGEVVSIAPGEPYLEPVTESIVHNAYRHTEDLLGVEHDILLTRGEGNSWSREYRIPEGHYFMIGDNRDSSSDSRAWGVVPEANLVGKAVRIWMNYRGMNILWNRIGDKIQ